MSGEGARVDVRPANLDDVPAIAAAWTDAGHVYQQLNSDLFKVPSGEGLEDRFRQRVPEQSEEQVLLVAEVDGEVVGWVHVLIEAPMEAAATQLQREFSWVRCHVNALVVAETSRGQGVGTRLMHEAESWARDRGARIVSLDAFA